MQLVDGWSPVRRSTPAPLLLPDMLDIWISAMLYQYFPGTFLLHSWYFPSTFKVQYFQRTFLVLSFYLSITFPIHSKYFFGNISVISWQLSGTFPLLYRYFFHNFTDNFPVIFNSFDISWYCPGIYQFFPYTFPYFPIHS